MFKSLNELNPIYLRFIPAVITFMLLFMFKKNQIIQKYFIDFQALTEIHQKLSHPNFLHFPTYDNVIDPRNLLTLCH